MQPRPPLAQRLRPGQRLALEILTGAGYGLVCWVLFAHKISPWPVALAGTVLVAVPLATCRWQPSIAFCAALAGFWAAPVAPELAFLAIGPMGYVLYRFADRYRPQIALPALAVALSGPAATAIPGSAGGVIPCSVALVLAWTIGYARGQHRRYDEELVRHHAGLAQVERERARRGAAEERMRIARELHDVVAHSMSVITVQAGYGHLVLDEKPDEARAALSIIETTGRQTLAEMRQLLGVLRQDDEPQLGPAPGLGDLQRLVALTGRAGVRVELALTGNALTLPAGIELAVYRIVQEALTNVVKHAGAATARVTIGCTCEDLDVEVTDDGRGGPMAPDGLGLAGMRERAEVYGGRLNAGPLPEGGFRVSARLPLPAVEPVA